MKITFTLLTCLFTGVFTGMAQTLEFIANGGPAGQGPTTNAQTVNFSRNTDNPSGNTFVTPSPPVSVTFSLSNQRFTAPGQPAGIQFGASASNASATPVPENLYVTMDSVGRPVNAMLTAAAPANSGGINVTGGMATNPNYGLRLLLHANYLEGMPLDTTAYYGDLTLTFSQAVTNPVLQLSGMGAAFSGHGRSAELKLKTPGMSLTELDGNQFFSVSGVGVTNIADTITGFSRNIDTNKAGAATGSVQINGTNITSVTLEVHLKGDGNGSQWQSNSGRSGEVFVIGVSLRDIITLSGNVFHDMDGMSDSQIDNNSIAQGYPFIASQLYANLFDAAGNFAAAVPVLSNGTYSASVAPDMNYTIIISTAQGGPGTSTTANFAPVLPAGWGFTGEGIVATGDSMPDGRIIFASVNNADVANVNFGIDPLPDSYDRINNVSNAPPVTGVDYSLNTVPLQGSEGNTAGNTAGNWTGKKLLITSLPTNAFELLYNGTVIIAAAMGTEGYTIDNYDTSLLSIRSTANTPPGTTTTSFTYAVIDSAGLKDPSPATYTVNFSAPLLVEIFNFNASVACPEIQLTWQTAVERNIRLMELQASANGNSFSTIAKKMPRGNNSSYKVDYIDKDGTYLFRLRITGQDGAYSYSNVLTASLNCDISGIEVYPVPLRGNTLTVLYHATEKAEVVFYDAQGRMLRRATLQPGRNEIGWNGYSSGTYWMKLSGSPAPPIQIVRQ